MSEDTMRPCASLLLEAFLDDDLTYEAIELKQFPSILPKYSSTSLGLQRSGLVFLNGPPLPAL
jgi:hypothetical protein